jgi:hypothetical protein
MSSNTFAGGIIPQAPRATPSATAMTYINTYKLQTQNFFAHGYVIDLASVSGLSTTGVRIYNALNNGKQAMILAPLTSSFQIQTGGTCFMQSDERLCPRFCDIVEADEATQVGTAQASSCVDMCISSHRYESVNALNIFTSTLKTLQEVGFKFVRIYNGVDATGKRFVVYVPLDATGKEMILENLFVGDFTSVMENCKYPG